MKWILSRTLNSQFKLYKKARNWLLCRVKLEYIYVANWEIEQQQSARWVWGKSTAESGHYIYMCLCWM